MKKNKMMRIASVLLIAVLMSTCAISGTFAKYVTEGSSTDTARVAKWGVKIDSVVATDNEFFKGEYETNDTELGAGFTYTVDSSDADDVIAPGTEGEWINVSISGTPEVAVAVSYVADLDLGDKWVDESGAYYCPIEITVGSDTFKGTTYASAAEFEAAVEAAIVAKKATYAPNTNLEEVEDDVEISWAWAFETGDSDDAKAANNIKDSYLGDQAAEGNAAEITLTINITIEQID